MTDRWSHVEDQRLRELWPVGGYEAVRQYLPRRTYSAIATRASTLGVRAPAHVKPVNGPREKL